MKTISIYEAKAHFSRIVAEAEQGGMYVICRHGKPVAQLTAPPRPSGDPLEPDPALRGARFQGDACAPLDERDWPSELR